MKTVEIYTKSNCIYCNKAKAWLKNKQIEFTEIEINSFNKELLLERVPHARTVPQIFVDGVYIGGYEDLIKTNIFED